jgi:hypothetical protein
MTDIENLVMKEACQLGLRPNADAVRRAGIDLAGSVMTTDGLIAMPGKGSIHPADFVRSLRNAMPESFAAIADKPATSDERQSGETLTDFMRRQVEAGRKRGLPADWDQIRSRAIGLTKRCMDEIEAKRRRN